MANDKRLETPADVAGEMRKCADAADTSIWDDERIAGLVENEARQQLVYAGRIIDAAYRDDRLMLKLLEFCIEDYYDDWASDDFRDTVKTACARLGIEYCTRGWGIEEQIAAKVAEIDRAPRVMCKHAPTQFCVDCELCKGVGHGR